LSIAGSDSGGAAGLQADLKTWTALGVYGMSAVTVVTAQNSVRVERAHFLPPDLVAAQIDAVLSDYGAAAIKTGFLGRVELIEAVAERLASWRERLSPRPFILVDPVLVNHRGEPMFPPEVAAAVRERLFPPADLVTPNRHEAALLAGRPLPDVGDGEGLARFLASLGAERVLLKGVRIGVEVVDAYWDGREVALLGQPAIDTENLHGSGDTLSAAICAFTAKGLPLLDAIRQAQSYTHAAIGRGAGWRLGAGHGPLGHAQD
jgi:hydroxymethylpyrimidine/phosphomethylpyrimidine kinase